jgi:O6-methylguanine-DNA--protein-cysteine methyltransferase
MSFDAFGRRRSVNINISKWREDKSKPRIEPVTQSSVSCLRSFQGAADTEEGTKRDTDMEGDMVTTKKVMDTVEEGTAIRKKEKVMDTAEEGTDMRKKEKVMDTAEEGTAIRKKVTVTAEDIKRGMVMEVTGTASRIRTQNIAAVRSRS